MLYCKHGVRYLIMILPLNIAKACVNYELMFVCFNISGTFLRFIGTMLSLKYEVALAMTGQVIW